MPKHQKFRGNLKWTRHNRDVDQFPDERGDYLHRYDQGRKQLGHRRSFPPTGNVESLKRAVNLNLISNPSDGSVVQNTGLANGEAWLRLIVIYGAPLSIETVQELVNTALSTQQRFYNVCVDGQNVVLHAKIRHKQYATYRKSLQSLRSPVSNKVLPCDLSIVVEPRLPPISPTDASSNKCLTLPDAWVNILRSCFLTRFQSTTRSLDLSNLHNDPALLSQGLYLPLNKRAVMQAMVGILKENAAQLRSLNLSNNRLTHLNSLSPLSATTDGSPLVSIERIDLSSNPIATLNCLGGLHDIEGLVELDLTDTVIMMKFNRNQQSMVTKLQTILPGLKRLNGEDISQRVQFEVERVRNDTNRIPLPASILGCFPNEDISQKLLTFLKDYFTRYDSETRGEAMLAYYNPTSQLVFSVAPEVRNVQPMSLLVRTCESQSTDGNDGVRTYLCSSRLHQVYLDNNRNLFRCREEDRRRSLITRGSLAISSLFNKLPATEHVLDSLSVDVAFHSPTQLLFTITGVFYEVHSFGRSPKTEKTVRKTLRCFSRTMTLVAPEGHIVQEDYIISNPSHTLRERYLANVAKRLREQAASSVPVPSNSIAPPAQTILPPSTGLQPLDPSTQNNLIAQLCQRTGMNESFSRRCLEEYAWDFTQALTAFQNLNAVGQIPPTAFV